LSNKEKLKIAYGGIIYYFLYYLVTAGFFISGTDISLILWEVGIILGGVVQLVILLSIIEHTDEKKKAWRIAFVVFMTCTIALTWIAHFVNLTVVMPLEANGTNIPDYFKFGQWPSAIMAVEYLAWGGGMGLAFIFGARTLTTKYAEMKKVKYTMTICGCLCLLGMLGVVFISELSWLLAPAGFAVGTPIICAQMISFYKKQDTR